MSWTGHNCCIRTFTPHLLDSNFQKFVYGFGVRRPKLQNVQIVSKGAIQHSPTFPGGQMNAIAGATRRAKLNEIRASFVIFIPCSVFLPKIYCILITRLSWHSSYTCTRSIHFSSLPNILIHPSRSWGTTRLPSRCTNPSFLLGPRSSTQRRAKFRIEKNRWWGTLFWQWASSWLIDLILSFSSNPTRLSFPTNLIPPTSGGLITQVRTANSNCAFLGQYSRYGYLVLCSSF